MRSQGEVAEHFDRLAPHYHYAHGHGEERLLYRLHVIRGLIGDARRGMLLEIGCGTGVHLLALAGEFEEAVGTDLSPEMIREATQGLAGTRCEDRVEFRVDPAEELGTVADASMDVVLCVGALEHMLDRSRVMAQVRRVLAPAGRFVCLTPNGGSWWYRYLAPLLGRETRHLSTDRFLPPEELTTLVANAGLDVVSLTWWRFVPGGDLPPFVGPVLGAGEWLGSRFGFGWLQGGLAVAATRSPS